MIHSMIKTREFEGKSEKEAIDKAIEALALDREAFDVEILVNERKGLFRKGSVKIRIHLHDDALPVTVPTEGESKLIAFLKTLLKKMGFPGEVTISFREDMKIGLDISSRFSGILIGKRGKNLDALQVLTNVYAGRIGLKEMRIIVDAEKYRVRREESIIRLARRTADQVKRSQRSRLLELMNPFERRLIHTTLNKVENIDTISEGEGLLKQVRVIYREH